MIAMDVLETVTRRNNVRQSGRADGKVLSTAVAAQLK